MSMVKLIYSDAANTTTDVRMRIVHDAQGLTKSAGTVFGREYDQLKPEKGHVGIHLTALGEYERYGLNRNFDGFSKQSCIKEHDTFVKNGTVFRHHCFVAGTPIVMADRSRVDIDQIQIGDMVSTELGPRRVDDLFKRDYSGPAVVLDVLGIPSPIVVTPNHRFKVYRRSRIHCRHNYNVLTESQHATGHCNELHELKKNLTDPEDLEADSLETGDYLCLLISESGNEVVDLDFAEAVGWIASEGHLGSRGSIQFTFSVNSRHEIEAVTSCFTRLGLHVGIHHIPQYGTAALSMCSKELSSRVSEFVSGTKADKMLSGKILGWNEEARLRLLGAYIDGDGHVPPGGKNAGQLRIRSSSPQMLNVLADVIRSLCIPCSVNMDTPPGFMVSPTNHKVYPASGSGCVSVASAYSPAICKYSRKMFVRDGRLPSSLIVGKYMLVRILSTELAPISEPVYNIEVNEAHHYQVQGVVVHNCNKDRSKGLGSIKASAYNEPMGRIELFIHVNEEKAKDELSRLEKEGEIPFSMATKVPYDVCTKCGAKRKNSEDPNQCEHIRDELGKMASDGTVVGMLNPENNWFDISFVGRPADRIAWNLKIAAGEAIDSVKLAQAEGLWVPDYMAIESEQGQRKYAHLKAIVEFQDMYCGILTKQASCSSGPVRYYFELRKAAGARLDDATIKQLRCFEPKVAFATLAKAGVILDPSSFFKYAMGIDYGEIAPYVPDAIKAVPGCMERLVKEGDCQRVCNDCTFDVAIDRTSLRAVPLNLIRELSTKAATGSVRDERVIAVTLDGNIPSFTVDGNRKSCNNGSVTVALAEKYAAYKIAAVEAVLACHPDRDTDSDSVRAIAAAQNLID